ncbi:hypothetical protein VTK26DRAFT_1281 [Humicola hyalothermophila]
MTDRNTNLKATGSKNADYTYDDPSWLGGARDGNDAGVNDPNYIDPAYAAAIARFGKDIVPVPPRDAAALRRINDAATEGIMSRLRAPATPTVTETVLHYESSLDHATLALHKFAPAPSYAAAAAATSGTQGKPGCILYVHGGGFLSGSVTLFRKDIIRYAAATGMTVFAPAYRLAPEHPHPTAVEDVFDALYYLCAHANEPGVMVNRYRIALLGVSAGGGIAAGVALLARDWNFDAVAKLVLLAPMLDDRTASKGVDADENGNGNKKDPLGGWCAWTATQNEIGWKAYLSGDGKQKLGAGDEEVVSKYAAPARARDLSEMPRTYIDVGGLDLFKDECKEFAERLAKADVQVEFHLYPGVPHAWEWFAPDIPVTRQAMTNRVRVLRDWD